MLGNIPVVKIGDANIQQDIQQEGEVKQGKIKPILRSTYLVLDRPVNAQYPKRLNQQIQKQQEGQIGDKFLLHNLAGLANLKQFRGQLFTCLKDTSEKGC